MRNVLGRSSLSGALWQRDAGCGPGPAPLLRVLPGGPTSNQIGVSGLAGSLGEAITCTRASSKHCTKADGSLVLLGNNVAAVEPNGLLIEPAATNLVDRSSNLTAGGWSTAGSGAAAPTLTANTADTLDPALGNTATKAVFPATTTTNQYSIVLNFTTANVVSGTTYVLSMWLKGTGNQTFYFSIDGNGVGPQAFATCAVTSAWQRFTLSWTATASTGTPEINVGSDTRTFTAHESPMAAQTVYIWGVQFEAGSVATSNITTTSGSATRASDSVSLGTIAPGAALSFSADVNLRAINSVNQKSILRVYNASNDQWSLIVGTDGTIAGNYNNGSNHIASSSGSITTGTPQRVALSYDGATLKTWLNGTPASGSFVFSPSTSFSNLYIGTNPGNAADAFNGWLSNIRIFSNAYSVF